MAQKKKGLGRGIDDIYFDNHITETTESGGTIMVRISDVEPNADQPRKNFDAAELEALSESITMYGMIQPITVRRVGGLFELIAGERRLRATQMAGLKEIPAIVVQADDEESAVLALIENIQRENLSYMEEALGYLKLAR